MDKILISKCLLGENVKYSGGNNKIENPIIERWQKEGRLIPICPEVEGGLPTPRPPSEIQGELVINNLGCDVTRQFVSGAEAACEKAKSTGAKYALMKQGSPSCGSKKIYDGTFSGTKIKGMGITAKMISDMGIRIFDESEIDIIENIIDNIIGDVKKDEE